MLSIQPHLPITAMATQNGACKTVLAGTIAKKLLAEVQDGLKTLDRKPTLHGFLANKDPAARMYADWTAKTCKEKCVPARTMTFRRMYAKDSQVDSTSLSAK